MPQRTVPLSRLLPAWLLLLGPLPLTFLWLLLSDDPLALMVPAGVGWMFTAKAAVLLCMDPQQRRRLSWGRFVACVLFPNMQPRLFLPERVPLASDIRPTLAAVLINAGCGLALLYLAPRVLPEGTPLLVRAWVGMVGAALVALFVRFDIAVAVFRWLGFGVERLWHSPGEASSLADFWGHRWNRVFSGLREVILLPLGRRVGTTAAMLAVFVYSGVMHEATSFAGHGGYGGPTLYFLIQAAGVWAEGRGGLRRWAKRWPWLGRAWAALVVIAPLPLLFHEPFMMRVMVPMLRGMSVPGL